MRHTQRLQAVLEEANVKLASVITDILGASGRRILKAMIAGETDPSRLAELGSPRLGCTRHTLVEALDGRVREHHRFLLDQHLKTIEQMEETVAVFVRAPRGRPRALSRHHRAVETGAGAEHESRRRTTIGEIGLTMRNRIISRRSSALWGSCARDRLAPARRRPMAGAAARRPPCCYAGKFRAPFGDHGPECQPPSVDLRSRKSLVRAAISSAFTSRAKWPASRTWTSASGTSRRYASASSVWNEGS